MAVLTICVFVQSDVNGANMNEVFAWIKSKKTSLGGTSTVKWNFEKVTIHIPLSDSCANYCS